VEDEKDLAFHQLDFSGEGFRCPADKKPLKRDEKYKKDNLNFSLRIKTKIRKNYLHESARKQRKKHGGQVQKKHKVGRACSQTGKNVKKMSPSKEGAIFSVRVSENKMDVASRRKITNIQRG
jgi:hypothetical protein